MILGCIGDDFTGSSDVANTLAKGGMHTALYPGIPDVGAVDDVDAGVVALKTRTVPVAEAVAASLAALDWLRQQGCRQFLFKYCSTFDSTDEGNIGPVAEALADALGASAVVACPAFPSTGRTIYQGHLFVGDRLLSESGMQNHPLTPMHDPDLRRVLSRQSRAPAGHVPHQVVRQGPQAIADALAKAEARLLIVDAISDDDLIAIGTALADAPLITGGSGIALGLPANYRRAGYLSAEPPVWQGQSGPAAVLAGSVSQATRGQVAHHEAAGQPVLRLDVDRIASGNYQISELADWVFEQQGIPLVTTTADPDAVAAAQQRHGREAVSAAIEQLFADLARTLVERGVTRLISAGGETSGAVVGALGNGAMSIGPEIDPGVPALLMADRPLVLALKSGNFGAENFFMKAARVLEGQS